MRIRGLLLPLFLAVGFSFLSHAAAQIAPGTPPDATTDPQAVRFAVAHQHESSWCFGYLYVSSGAISYVVTTPATDQQHSFNLKRSQVTSAGAWIYRQQPLKALRLEVGNLHYHFWWLPDEQVVQSGRPYQWNPPDAADPRQIIEMLSGPPQDANATVAGPNPNQGGLGVISSAEQALSPANNNNLAGAIGARIGLRLGNLTPERSQALGLSSTDGALVEQLDPNGTAALAGVHVDDVITNLNGTSIVQAMDVRRALRHVRRGGTAKLQVLRQGQAMTLKVVAN